MVSGLVPHFKVCFLGRECETHIYTHCRQLLIEIHTQQYSYNMLHLFLITNNIIIILVYAVGSAEDYGKFPSNGGGGWNALGRVYP